MYYVIVAQLCLLMLSRTLHGSAIHVVLLHLGGMRMGCGKSTEMGGCSEMSWVREGECGDKEEVRDGRGGEGTPAGTQ